VEANQISDNAGEAVLEGVGREMLRRAFLASWMAIALGITVQLLVWIGRVSAGGQGIGFAAQLAQGLTWSLLVCAGIAVGTAAARSRELLTGLLGLLAAPVAWGVAKGAQRTVQELVGAEPAAFDALFWYVCMAKGVEYAILGAALAHMIVRQPDRAGRFVMLGGCVGAVTAIVMVLLNLQFAKSFGPPQAVALAINEIVFPIGCSLVIFAIVRLRRFVGLTES